MYKDNYVHIYSNQRLISKTYIWQNFPIFERLMKIYKMQSTHWLIQNIIYQQLKNCILWTTLVFIVSKHNSNNKDCVKRWTLNGCLPAIKRSQNFKILLLCISKQYKNSHSLHQYFEPKSLLIWTSISSNSLLSARVPVPAQIAPHALTHMIIVSTADVRPNNPPTIYRSWILYTIPTASVVVVSAYEHAMINSPASTLDVVFWFSDMSRLPFNLLSFSLMTERGSDLDWSVRTLFAFMFVWYQKRSIFVLFLRLYIGTLLHSGDETYIERVYHWCCCIL